MSFAQSAAIAIISRPQLGLLSTLYLKVSNIHQVKFFFKIIFMKFEQKWTVITIKVIGRLFDISEHD